MYSLREKMVINKDDNLNEFLQNDLGYENCLTNMKNEFQEFTQKLDLLNERKRTYLEICKQIENKLKSAKRKVNNPNYERTIIRYEIEFYTNDLISYKKELKKTLAEKNCYKLIY